MSATEKLLLNINEYHNLLGFLNEKHKTVLDEWKNKNAGVDETPAADETRDADIPGVNQNDYRDK